jgi:hypothetical protein
MQRRSADEPFWMGLISEIENGLPFRNELSGLTIVNNSWSQQVQARVVVLLVVPRKEFLAEKTRVLD